MSKEVTFTIAEISKLNLEPGDLLTVKLIGYDWDQETTDSVQGQFRKIFPNNKVAVFILPPSHDMKFEVVRTASSVALPGDIGFDRNPLKNDCSVPTSYCDSCACGKKERVLAAKAPKVDSIEELIAKIESETKEE